MTGDSLDANTTVELVGAAASSHLVVDLAFHQKVMTKKDKKLRQAKLEIHKMHADESVMTGDDDLQQKTPEGHDTGPENDSFTSHLESENSASTVQNGPLPVWPTVKFMVIQ